MKVERNATDLHFMLRHSWVDIGHVIDLERDKPRREIMNKNYKDGDVPCDGYFPHIVRDVTAERKS
jgi:hypothetical protein